MDHQEGDGKDPIAIKPIRPQQGTRNETLVPINWGFSEYPRTNCTPPMYNSPVTPTDTDRATYRGCRATYSSLRAQSGARS